MASRTVYKFALIQLQPTPVAPEDNFNRAAALLRQAASDGAHLAILPEYHLTSWVPEHPDFVSSSAASASYLPRYQALAREFNINIVPGTICSVSGDATDTQSPDFEMRNMAYFIAAGTGDITASYQKKNLWHPERPHLTSSAHTPHEAFDTPLTHPDGRPVRAGLLICWDLAFPEAFRELIADGAELILIPSFWHLWDTNEDGRKLNPDGEKVFLEAVTVARAYENTCCVVFCNSGGASQVAMPILGALGKIDDCERDEMRVVEVDLDVLRVSEENYKVRADMKGEGWHYAYTLVRDKQES